MWHELRQFGATILDPVLVGEAQLVCDEMAHRARHNVNLIVERLRNDGYRFHSNDDAQTPGPPFVRANAGAGEHADWLQRAVGPVPMTVRPGYGWSGTCGWSGRIRTVRNRPRLTRS